MSKKRDKSTKDSKDKKDSNDTKHLQKQEYQRQEMGTPFRILQKI